MSICLSNLVEISKLFIPVIAFAGVYIAWQQSNTNRVKIKLDLYDKRFALYNTVISSVFEYIYGGEFENKDYVLFFTACNEAKFLVPDNVYKEIDDIRKLVLKGRIIKNKLNNPDLKRVSAQELEEYRKEIVGIESKIEDLYPNITESFKTVLKFKF